MADRRHPSLVGPRFDRICQEGVWRNYCSGSGFHVGFVGSKGLSVFRVEGFGVYRIYN